MACAVNLDNIAESVEGRVEELLREAFVALVTRNVHIERKNKGMKIFKYLGPSTRVSELSLTLLSVQTSESGS